jgi:hypothetical protein
MMMTVNVKSVLYGMQTVVPYYKQQRRGHVINVGSLLGRVPFASLRAAYRRDTVLLPSPNRPAPDATMHVSVPVRPIGAEARSLTHLPNSIARCGRPPFYIASQRFEGCDG